MIYEPTFTAEITILDETVYSIYQLRERINDIEYEMQEIEREISMYCCADMKSVVPGYHEGEPILFIKDKIRELMREYNQLSIKGYQMRKYLDFEPDFSKKEAAEQ